MKNNILDCTLNLINEETEKKKLKSNSADVGAEIGRGLGYAAGVAGTAVKRGVQAIGKNIKDRK